METKIFSDIITLGQFLKHEGIIGSGGEAKWFLSENEVLLNHEIESRRGKKLQHGDVLDLGEFGQFKIEYKQ
ncbi:S4 domain-containing protein YaaA [Lacicoccus alkaliphilus]|uniref:S4 domain protein YaaA n=1 Tax=Lacicoccus alkaliphilus DSM 16010 TaxID=1123231 RepID=A0A1M7GHR6_9BACL|nr:S4 domain-containing protein YaaA [Salinicoccus alkaliphilus]SHM15726.1 S4 domain protein YaaA [Salinicoccus alkaliphilus DSM 16010]